jgi:hypothetical protein
MIELEDVEDFKGILIHPLNDHTETEGCLGPGLICDTQNERVLSSTLAYEPLYMLITDALLAGTSVTLKIKDEHEL